MTDAAKLDRLSTNPNQQDREEWVEIAFRAVLVAYPFDWLEARDMASAVVDALLVHLGKSSE